MRLSILIAAILLPAGLHAQDTEVTGRFPAMTEIPAGYFWMGSSGWGHNYDEAPVHKVTFTEGFRMSVTEITNAQFEEFMPEHRASRQMVSRLSTAWSESRRATSWCMLSSW